MALCRIPPWSLRSSPSCPRPIARGTGLSVPTAASFLSGTPGPRAEPAEKCVRTRSSARQLAPAASATGSSRRAARCWLSATPAATARSACRTTTAPSPSRPRPTAAATGSPAGGAASTPLVTPSTTARWRDVPWTTSSSRWPSTADGGGYWLAGSGGEVFHFGDAANLEPPTPVTTRSPFVGIAVDSSGTGAWTSKQDGVVLNFGTAVDHGSLGVAPASRVTAIAAMPIPSAGTGRPLGYDLAEADGTVSTLGGATYYGSRSSTKLVAPIVALLPTPDHRGYWLIGADGSVFPSAMPRTRARPAARCGRTRSSAQRRRPTAAATGS